MAIVDTQVSKFVDEAIEKILSKGKFPTSSSITTLTNKFSARADGGPLFRPIITKDGSQFPVARWNTEMEFVQFDLDVLYEELVQQALGLMRRTSYSETTYRSQRGQLDRIISLLEDLEFTISNADAGFIGISDHLTDMARLDVYNSTSGVQDLNEESVLIPPTALGTERIKMNHMARSHLREVKVTQPVATKVVSSFTSSNAPFSNCFQDLSLTWRHDVITHNHEGLVEIQVTFPVAENGSLQQITRVSLVPHSESAMVADVLTSNDGVNFVAVPGGMDVPLSNMKVETNLDFERKSVKYIRLKLRKDLPDEQVAGGSRYSFGLRSIALLRAVRAFSATYQTVRLVPKEGQIERVALEVDEQTPSGTTIDYFIRAGTGEFTPITPITRTNGYAPSSLLFGKSRRVDLRFTADNPTVESTINALPIYIISPPLDTGNLTGEVIYGSAKMWRGRNGWHRTSGIEETSRMARDMYVHFGTDPEQQLWVWEAETATYSDGENANGDDIGVLSLDGNIYYEYNSGHRMVAPHNVNTDTDPHPTYAISEIIAHRSASLNTGEVLDMGIGETSTFTHRNIDENEPIVGTAYGQTFVGGPVLEFPLTEGVHYELNTLDSDDNYLNGEVKLLALNSLLIVNNQLRFEWSYTIATNITHMVTKIERNNVYLFAPIVADWFEVKYRMVPSGIIRSSIVVKNTRGEADKIYSDGKDYRVDVDDGDITRLSGSLIGDSVYVDFQFRRTERDIDTYDTWVYVDRDDPFKIEFENPGLDKASGENFFLYTSIGKVDLTDATETPLLSRGWYKFATLSQPIEIAGSAINLILAMVDRSSTPIFTGSAYFSEIRAFRDPMLQTTESGLKYATRKDDHTKFAIVDSYVLTNFLPGDTEDVITHDYALIEQDELFELSYLADSGGSPSDISLKAILKRDPATDQGITPKMFWWAIRLKR